MSLADSTYSIFTPFGTVRAVVAEIKITSAPFLTASSANAYPIFPEESFEI